MLKSTLNTNNKLHMVFLNGSSKNNPHHLLTEIVKLTIFVV